MMKFLKQNRFKNLVPCKQMKMERNPIVRRAISDLKAMSLNPHLKNQVLSTLNRFQNQMSQQDYNEILRNVKSFSNRNITENHGLNNHLGTLQFTEEQYQNVVFNLRRLERETRFR